MNFTMKRELTIIKPGISAYLIFCGAFSLLFAIGLVGKHLGKNTEVFIVIGILGVVGTGWILSAIKVVIEKEEILFSKFWTKQRFIKSSVKYQFPPTARGPFSSPYELLVWDPSDPQKKIALSLKYFTPENVRKIMDFLNGR